MPSRLPFADLLDLPALTLATSSPEGAPHAATVYFVCDDRLTFYFFSAPHSQHIQDLVQNPAAALTLDWPAGRWQEIRGLQLRGTVREVDSPVQAAAALARYLAKFPYVRGLEREILKNRWYTFSPEWLRWIDNRIRFGHKQEWSGAALEGLRQSSSLYL